jgi:hypothetical protein
MADKRITELPDATLPIASGVKFEAVQGGVNVKVDADDMPGSAAGVTSVNGDTGPAVVLDATDVGADPAGTAAALLTTTITNGDTTHAPDGNSVFDALALKSNVTPAARSGTSIQFDVLATYGAIASPETGNITKNASGAVVGVVQLLIHALYNSTPTFGSEFVLLGSYTPTEINYIYMELLADGNVLTTIRTAV